MLCYTNTNNENCNNNTKTKNNLIMIQAKEIDRSTLCTEDDYVCQMNAFWTAPFLPNLLNSTVFLVETSQMIAVFFTNYKGNTVLFVLNFLEFIWFDLSRLVFNFFISSLNNSLIHMDELIFTYMYA